MAKDGVDGIYSADPDEDPKAKKIDEITASEVLERNLKVADASAISLARDNELPIKVLSMEELDLFDDPSVGSNIKAK